MKLPPLPSMLASLGLMIVLHLGLPDSLQAIPTPTERAQAVFDSAITTHRSLHELNLKLNVQLDERAELVMPNESGTTCSIVRRWRHECRADYRLGALVSETYRTSETVDGIELVDFRTRSSRTASTGMQHLGRSGKRSRGMIRIGQQ